MIRPAAIAGTFADAKSIKTRSTYQLIIEIPIEDADKALAALGGVPQPGNEKPVAVAALAETPAQQTEEAKAMPEPETQQAAYEQALHNGTLTTSDIEQQRTNLDTIAKVQSAEPDDASESKSTTRPDPHHYSRQAAMLCKDARFQQFLWERYCGTANVSAELWEGDDREMSAAKTVCEICNVISRKYLDTSIEPRERWIALYAEYMAE